MEKLDINEVAKEKEKHRENRGKHEKELDPASQKPEDVGKILLYSLCKTVLPR